MSWIAVAVIGGSVLGGLGSAAISSSGAQAAAQTQANAANQAAQIGWNEFNTINQQQAPYMQSGYGAQSNLNYLLGVTPETNSSNWNDNAMVGFPGFGPSAGNPANNHNIGPTPSGPTAQYIPHGGGSSPGGFGSLLSPFTADTFHQYSPAYQFQQEQGMQGVLNGDESSVGALSGAAQKDLIGFNQGLANTSFDTAFNQYQTQQGNIYSRLAGLAQLGQNSASNTGAQGVNLAGQIGQSVTNAGSARAAGQVGSANAWSGAVNQAGYLPWLTSGGNPNTNAANWDTENPSNFQDFTPVG